MVKMPSILDIVARANAIEKKRPNVGYMRFKEYEPRAPRDNEPGFIGPVQPTYGPLQHYGFIGPLPRNIRRVDYKDRRLSVPVFKDYYVPFANRQRMEMVGQRKFGVGRDLDAKISDFQKSRGAKKFAQLLKRRVGPKYSQSKYLQGPRLFTGPVKPKYSQSEHLQGPVNWRERGIPMDSSVDPVVKSKAVPLVKLKKFSDLAGRTLKALAIKGRQIQRERLAHTIMLKREKAGREDTPEGYGRRTMRFMAMNPELYGARDGAVRELRASRLTEDDFRLD